MSAITDKVSYLKGLMEGLKLDASSNEGMIIQQIVDVLDDMAGELNDIAEAQDELSEYVDTIDEDLSDLQDMLDGEGLFDSDDDDEDDEDEDDEEDEDEDEDDNFEGDACGCHCDVCGDECDASNVYVECICPECKAAFYAREADMDKGAKFHCPRCKKVVEAVPEYEDEIPVAELYRGEDQ